MDVDKLLKTIKNVNDYISVTHDVSHNFSNSKAQLNFSTVSALNKIRSMEIEYFNKCGENGAALQILELILHSPPSKTWTLLGKKLIILVQYWLDALRKHLIEHNNNWWNFLQILLKFIQKICSKHSSMNNILVEHTAESLLDIATKDQPELLQRYAIIQCLNSFCSEASREIRSKLQKKFDNYFIKLSSLLPKCGDVRLQYSIMETLLRWLLPRQDSEVRKDSLAKWFPNMTCNIAIEIFLKRSWQNFFKDARDFLNALNETSDVVMSVLCRKFLIGYVVLVSGDDENDHWIDINFGSKSISLMLETRHYIILDSSVITSGALCISEDNTNNVQMLRQSSEIIIKLNVIDPFRMYPSNILKDCDVTIAISTQSDVGKVDKALRNIFDTKYRLLLNVEDFSSLQLSPQHKRNDNRSRKVDEPRFTKQSENKRGRHSGYIIRSKNLETWQTPSTASTSSLAMLREKLSDFPDITFDKEPVSVCALPQLSTVTEVSEPDLNINKATCHSNIDNENKPRSKSISPVIDEDSVSCLLVATIGSAYDSVIHDTLERLPNKKDIHTDNIVYMLAQEALNASKEKTNDKRIENKKKIPDKQDINLITPFITNTVVVNRSIVKENIENINILAEKSNIAVVDTSVSNNNRYYKNPETFDSQQAEDAFLQREKRCDLIRSPNLAQKINASSSESSFDICSFTDEYKQRDIIECLKEIVDIVSRNLDKRTVLLENCNIDEDATVKVQKKMEQSIEQPKRKAENIKLKFTDTKKKPKPKRKKKNDLDSFKKMSIIVERDSNIKSSSEVDNKDDFNTPLVKRRRKLYSPKDDSLVEKKGVHVSETEEDTILSNNDLNENLQKTPTLAVTYKEIENIRKKSRRNLCNKNKAPVTSRTKNNDDAFDSLKETKVNDENIMLVNRKKLAVYNNTSDSDEDFEISNRRNKSKEPSKIRPKRSNTKINYSEIISVTDDENYIKTKRKTTKKSNSKNKKNILKPEIIDERMRGSLQKIIDSPVIDKSMNEELAEPIPVDFKPIMELIKDKENTSDNKKDKQKSKLSSVFRLSDREHTESPLPGLVVESVRDDSDDSIKKLITVKFNDKYHHLLPDATNTTQNLLSDINEDHNIPIELNITDEYDKIVSSSQNKACIKQNKTEKNKISSRKKTVLNDEISINSDYVDNCSEKSISTLGKSPITAHGNLDESPPSTKQLKQLYHPRGLETQDLNKSMKDYFDKLTSELNKSNNSSNSKLSINLTNEKLNEKTSPAKSSIFTKYPTTSIKRLSPMEITKYLPSRHNSVFDSNQSLDSISTRTRNQTKKYQYNVSKYDTKISENDKPYKSIISPINFFEKLPTEDKASEDDDFVNRIKSMITRKKKLNTFEPVDSKSPRYNLRRHISLDSKNSSKSKSPQIAIKRRKSSATNNNENRINFNSESIQAESSANGFSVKDWLEKNERVASIKTADSTDLSLKDSLENIMEKLDTTLVEIHHTTSKKFVGMFVEAQMQMNELKEQRGQMLKATAKNVVTKIIGVLDEEFTNFNKSSQELDEQFLASIKEQAKHLIQEDCEQKRIMLSILKDEIQSVLNSTKKRKSASDK